MGRTQQSRSGSKEVVGRVVGRLEQSDVGLEDSVVR